MQVRPPTVLRRAGSPVFWSSFWGGFLVHRIGFSQRSEHNLVESPMALTPSDPRSYPATPVAHSRCVSHDSQRVTMDRMISERVSYRPNRRHFCPGRSAGMSTSQGERPGGKSAACQHSAEPEFEVQGRRRRRRQDSFFFFYFLLSSSFFGLGRCHNVGPVGPAAAVQPDWARRHLCADVLGRGRRRC